MIQNATATNKNNFKSLAYIKGTPKEIKTVKTLLEEAETYTLKYTDDLQTDIFATSTEKSTLQDYKKLLGNSKKRVQSLGNNIDSDFEKEHSKEYFPFSLHTPQNALQAPDVIKAIEENRFDKETFNITNK